LVYTALGNVRLNIHNDMLDPGASINWGLELGDQSKIRFQNWGLGKNVFLYIGGFLYSLIVPSTRLSTIGEREFPGAASRI